MAKELSIQELYDRLYMESASRARAKGDKPPTEVEVFEVLVKFLREKIKSGEESTEVMDELSEVKSFHIREQEEQQRKDAIDKGLREGNILDLDALLNSND